MENNKADEWVSMCSTYLKKHPYNYKLHLDYLCQNSLEDEKIFWKRKYATGRCYSYKNAPRFFTERVKIYEITDQKLLKYILKTNTLGGLCQKTVA